VQQIFSLVFRNVSPSYCSLSQMKLFLQLLLNSNGIVVKEFQADMKNGQYDFDSDS